MLFKIADPSQVAGARRGALLFAQASRFNEEDAGRVALVATEMATNLLKHGGGGHIIVDRYDDGEGAGVELLALDKGKGISDVKRSLEDGYSTAGSPGTGLGAIRRQADNFAIYSRPALGTAIMARFNRTVTAKPGITLGQIVDPYPGEIECGDAWTFGLEAKGPTLMMADGSGHGPAAAIAAQRAVEVTEANLGYDPVRLAETIHRALMPTRGGAIAVAQIDAGEQVVRFVGVGNIAGAMIDSGTCRRMVSHNGTAGHVAPRIREFTYPFLATVTLVLHSDGLSAKWALESYPGLMVSHPSLIAGVLFRDFRRGHDDASIVVLRMQK